jgi:predicted TIM-barrel fold metal-dependent hydrolase
VIVADSHTHVASPAYPFSPMGVGSDWWRSGATVVDLVAAMDAAGVGRAVVVQAVGAYGYDCRCACDAVAGVHGERLTLVVAVDMAGADPASDLVALAASAPVHGVRVFGVGGPPPVWLADGRADDVWAAAASLGITVVPTLFGRDLALLGSVVDRHPAVPVAIDHCGFPHPGADLSPALLALAGLPAVHLKVTTHVLRDALDPAGFVAALARAFGSERLCWGSDHPQSLGLKYSEMVTLGRVASAGLTPAGQEEFLAGTAARLWFPRSP